MHISWLFLLFIQAVTSSLVSDMWSRNFATICYTVVATDPTNAAQVAQTKAQLKNLDDNAEIIPKRTPEGTTVWLFESNNADLKDVISGFEGVDLVEQEARSELIRRDDVRKYIASANETSNNIEETEGFLDSKHQGDTKYQRILDGNGTTVLGWKSLSLTDDGAKAVVKYKGIAYPLGIEEYTEDRVLPSKLSARAETWVKQENADKALVMDSQFK
jgi:hypothetical protein